MRNLLPFANRKKVKREYRLRLITLTLFMAASVVAIGSISILPTLFLSQSKKLSIENQAEFVERSIAHREAEVSLETLRDSRSRLALLATEDEQTTLTETIEVLCQCETTPLVDIDGFFYETFGGIAKINVTGVASTRDALLSYKGRLERSEIFSSVELPISNLARDRDIEFTITVEQTR